MATHKSVIRIKKETHSRLRIAAFENNISIARQAEKIISEGLDRRDKRKRTKEE